MSTYRTNLNAIAIVLAGAGGVALAQDFARTSLVLMALALVLALPVALRLITGAGMVAIATLQALAWASAPTADRAFTAQVLTVLATFLVWTGVSSRGLAALRTYWARA